MTEHTKTQFTPGPWHITSEPDARVQRIAGVNAGGVTLVAKCETHLANSHSENVANARLIACAPDMLEALRGAEEWLQGWASAEPYLSIIRRAISKAEGK